MTNALNTIKYICFSNQSERLTRLKYPKLRKIIKDLQMRSPANFLQESDRNWKILTKAFL